jgi:hypothetical protein
MAASPDSVTRALLNFNFIFNFNFNFILRLFLRFKLNLVSTQRRETDGPSTRLDSVFEQISACTLFLPCAAKECLRNLDRVKPEQLNADFIADLQRLELKLFTDKPKTLTGSQIAVLLQNIHNLTDLPSLPSVWSQFISVQKSTALSISLSHFRSLLHIDHTLSRAQLDEKLRHATEASVAELRGVLRGFPQATIDVERQFQREIDQLSQRFGSDNARRVEDECKRLSNQAVLAFERCSSELQLPLEHSQLAERLERARSESTREFETRMSTYHNIPEFEACRESLALTIALKEKTVMLNNNELLDRVLESALETFANSLNSSLGVIARPIPTHELNDALADIKLNLSHGFAHAVRIAKSRTAFRMYADAANSLLQNSLAKASSENLGMIAVMFREQVQSIAGEIEATVRDMRTQVPMSPAQLRMQFAYEVDALTPLRLRKFQPEFSDFFVKINTIKTDQLSALLDANSKAIVDLFASRRSAIAPAIKQCKLSLCSESAMKANELRQRISSLEECAKSESSQGLNDFSASDEYAAFESQIAGQLDSAKRDLVEDNRKRVQALVETLLASVPEMISLLPYDHIPVPKSELADIESKLHSDVSSWVSGYARFASDILFLVLCRDCRV